MLLVEMNYNIRR